MSELEPVTPENSTQPAKRGQKEKPKKTLKREIFEWVVTIAAAVLIAFVIRTFLFEPVRVDGGSMLETLQDGEIMFVTKYDYLTSGPERFDVVICHYPNRGSTNFVKRVVGLPGETVSICDGVVHIDGRPLQEPYLDPRRNRRLCQMEPVTLGEREVFVLGDNRDSSNDSRRIGPIPLDMLRGKVRRVLLHLGWMERKPRRRRLRHGKR